MSQPSIEVQQTTPVVVVEGSGAVIEVAQAVNFGSGGGGSETDPVATPLANAAQATANAALPKSGGTMTGKITLDGDPTQNLHPATRQYVLAQITALVNGAPGALDTLKELADQLAADESAAAALATAVAGKQPLDSDLTAIAALTTAAYGRNLLTLANQAALQSAVGAASKAALRDTILAAVPALYWPLDSTYGITDQSANGRNGTGAGSITIGTAAGIDGTANGATTFNGSSHRITSTWAPYTTGSVRTFTVWAYLGAARSYQTIFGGTSSGTPYFPFLRPGETHFEAYTGAAQVIVNDALPQLGEWFQLALVVDDPNDLFLFYVNGQCVGGKSTASTYAASPGNLQLSGANGAFNLWNGRMAHAAIYDRVLSGSELRKQHLAGLGTLVA